MPFTFSHPAAVLPFGYFPKRFFSMTALVIGSLAPDFEYFLRMRAVSYYSHTWAGLLWFDLPLTIILAFFYHEIVRDKLIDNLPVFLTKRLLVFKSFNWTKNFKKNFFVVIISAAIGIASHIIWDAFTHEKGRIGREISRFKEDLLIAGHHVLTYNVLQYGSSVLGGLVILYALLKLPANKVFVRERSIFPFWLSVLVVISVIVALRALLGSDLDEFRNMVVTIISGGFIGILLTAIFFPSAAKKNEVRL